MDESPALRQSPDEIRANYEAQLQRDALLHIALFRTRADLSDEEQMQISRYVYEENSNRIGLLRQSLGIIPMAEKFPALDPEAAAVGTVADVFDAKVPQNASETRKLWHAECLSRINAAGYKTSDIYARENGNLMVTLEDDGFYMELELSPHADRSAYTGSGHVISLDLREVRHDPIHLYNFYRYSLETASKNIAVLRDVDRIIALLD